MSKRQATGGHRRDRDLNAPDDPEAKLVWQTKQPHTIDWKTSATEEQMSTRKIAPLRRNRAPGRTASPGNSINTMPNFFDPSQNPPANGVNGTPSFSTSFGQPQTPSQGSSQNSMHVFGNNTVEPNNSMFGYNQNQNKDPKFGQTPQNRAATNPTQSADDVQAQRAAASFPPNTGGGFSFSAGGTNPFTQQSSQQQNSITPQAPNFSATTFHDYSKSQPQQTPNTSQGPSFSPFSSTTFRDFSKPQQKPAEQQSTPQAQQPAAQGPSFGNTVFQDFSKPQTQQSQQNPQQQGQQGQNQQTSLFSNTASQPQIQQSNGLQSGQQGSASGNSIFQDFSSQQNQQPQNFQSAQPNQHGQNQPFGQQQHSTTFGNNMFQSQLGQQTQQSQAQDDQGGPTSPDNAMQISPPNTPARGTGQERPQQNSLFGVINQTPTNQNQSPSLFSGVNQSDQEPPSSLFTPRNDEQDVSHQTSIFQTPSRQSTSNQAQAFQPQSQFGQNQGSKQNPILSNWGQQQQQSQQQQEGDAGHYKAPQTPRLDQGFGRTQQQQQTHTPSFATNQLANPFANVKTPSQNASDTAPPATAPAKAALLQPQTSDTSSQPPNTEPRSGLFRNTNATSQSDGASPDQSNRFPSKESNNSSAVPATSQSLFTSQSTQKPMDSFSAAQRQACESQQKLVALNKGFLTAMQQMDMHRDQSDMMNAYLSEMKKVITSQSSMQGVTPRAADPNTSNKRKADDSSLEARSAKKGPSGPSHDEAAESPLAASQSQTSSLFSNILSQQGQMSSQQSKTIESPGPPASAEPPNPFAGIKTSSPAQPSSGLFTPKPQGKAGTTPSLVASKPSQSLYTQKPADQRATSPTTDAGVSSAKSSGPAASLFQTPSTSTSSGVKTKASSMNLFGGNSNFGQSSPKTPGADTPKAPTPSPFTNTSSAPDSSPFKPQSSTGLSTSAPVFNPFGKKPENGSPYKASPAPAFKPNLGSGGVPNFMAQFAQSAAKTEAKDKARRKAEEFDSEEDDEEEWERKDAEKQAEKKRKISEQAHQKVRFSQTGFAMSDSTKPKPSSPKKQDPKAQSSNETPSNVASSKSQTSNLFGHLTNGSNPSDAGSANSQADDEESSEGGEDQNGDDEGSERPSGTERDESEAPSERTPEPPNVNAGKGLFDRITPADKKDEPPVSETPKKNPFGLDSSTNGASGFSLFGSKTSPAGDHTWKPDSPITFGGEDQSAPTFKFSPSTPAKDQVNGTASSEAPKTPAMSLFGTPGQNNPTPSLFGNQSTSNPGGSLFGNPSNKQDQAGIIGGKPHFGFGAQKESSLLSAAKAAGDTTSNTSRGTSPALSNIGTDAEGESGNGTGDDGDAEKSEAEKQQQADFTAVPEDEDVIFEADAVRASALFKIGWKTEGVGVLRLLKNKNTGVHSLLLRKVPGGNIVFNTRLQKQLAYKDEGKARVTLGIPKETDQGPTIGKWLLSFGSAQKERAVEFAELTEGIKAKM